MKRKDIYRILPALCALGILSAGAVSSRGGMDHMTEKAAAEALAAAPIQSSPVLRE